MRNRIAACFATILATSPALAQESSAPTSGTEVCILVGTETITRPKKPNIFTNRLYCGSQTTPLQDYAIAQVNAKGNPVDAIKVAVDLGFSIEAVATFNAFNGHAIYTRYTLTRKVAPRPAAPEADEEPADAPEPAEPEGGSESLDGVEELDDL